MSRLIPSNIINQLRDDYDEILKGLIKKGYEIESIPTDRNSLSDTGEAFSLAYPIQGILKYHGMVNKDHRIAYFPSVSLNNSSAFTTTYIKFDPSFKEDSAYLNGNVLSNNDLNRIKNSLDAIRTFSKIRSKAVVISRNVSNSSISSTIGKGLGTSASGSAALALAAVSIIYDNNPDFVKNNRLISHFSRYLAGSGTRSAVGGFALWLSHPKINPLDCFAIRLDTEEHRKFVDKISLISISVDSELKTEQAHEIAPNSPFFVPWLKERKEKIFEFLEALESEDLKKIGEIAEYDSMCLHSITTTGSYDQKLIAWKPATIEIMLKVQELRASGLNVYFTIDTGPSVVILTFNKEKDAIIKELKQVNPEFDILEGKIEGPCKLIDSNSSQASLLRNDINEVLNN
jgi:diphosphomevalonate decarboxylase